MERWVIALAFAAGCMAVARIRRQRRRSRYARGRQLSKRLPAATSVDGGLQWGTRKLPPSAATQHFLAVGTTGSGKSLVQRLLMKNVLAGIRPDTDCRALIFDAKNDMLPFLHHVGVRCPVLSLNPFEARTDFPRAVAWDIAADVTSAARALNLAASLIPSEKGGSNQYFTDAARQAVAAVVESFIRHSPGVWTFSDFVYATLSKRRLEAVLDRDEPGREVLDNFFGDERTGYQVFTTIASRMSYYRPVAALWQRCPDRLSLREWLTSESILLFGMNATARTALDAINEIVFRIIVEEIDVQADSSSRRTWVWIDEARLSGPLLRGPLLPYLAVKGRSRGACLVLAFQDIEGFREAAGPRIANEIIAQCSHKALLRMESEESAGWGSRQLGQYEMLDVLHTNPVFLQRGGSRSEQVARRDAVLASEFYTIPMTSVKNGLTGFFVSPEVGAARDTIRGTLLQETFVDPELESCYSFESRPESDQQLSGWEDADRQRLQLDRQRPDVEQERPGRLKLIREGRRTND